MIFGLFQNVGNLNRWMEIEQRNWTKKRIFYHYSVNNDLCNEKRFCKKKFCISYQIEIYVWWIWTSGFGIRTFQCADREGNYSSFFLPFTFTFASRTSIRKRWDILQRILRHPPFLTGEYGIPHRYITTDHQRVKANCRESSLAIDISVKHVSLVPC